MLRMLSAGLIWNSGETINMYLDSDFWWYITCHSTKCQEVLMGYNILRL